MVKEIVDRDLEETFVCDDGQGTVNFNIVSQLACMMDYYRSSLEEVAVVLFVSSYSLNKKKIIAYVRKGSKFPQSRHHPLKNTK